MPGSMKRGREEDKLMVQQRRLSTTMGELEELVLANRRITESLVGDIEARVEELEEELAKKVFEIELKDMPQKAKNEAIKEMETLHQAEVEKLRLGNNDIVEASNTIRSGGEEQAPEETLTLENLESQEVSVEELDNFSFRGPSAGDPVVSVDGQKPAKRWRGEKGEDCGDCFNNWVHYCRQDIPGR